jgi:hypothetical protein
MRPLGVARAALTAAVVLAAGLLLLAVAAVQARREAARAEVPTKEEERQAIETVHSMVTLAAHLRGSGGDPRFAERIPASPPVLEALQRELEFARHLGVVEDPELRKFEVGRVRRVRPRVVEVDTREYWVTRQVSAAVRPPEAAPPAFRTDIVLTRWSVARQAGGWVVVDWQLAPPPEP